jgi:hypothetical protein
VNATQETIPFDVGHAAAAREWIDANPEAFAMFERFALELAAKGRRFGIALVTERVRWEVAFNYDKTDWKINNSHRAYIARELIARHPKLADLIETRRAGEVA